MTLPIRNCFRSTKHAFVRHIFPNVCQHLNTPNQGTSFHAFASRDNDFEASGMSIFPSAIHDVAISEGDSSEGYKTVVRQDRFGIKHYVATVLCNDRYVFETEFQEAMVIHLSAEDAVGAIAEVQNGDSASMEYLIRILGNFCDAHIEDGMVHIIFINSSILPPPNWDRWFSNYNPSEQGKIVDSAIKATGRFLNHLAHELQNISAYSELLAGDFTRMGDLEMPVPYQDKCDSICCSMVSLSKWLNEAEEIIFPDPAKRHIHGADYFRFFFHSSDPTSQQFRDLIYKSANSRLIPTKLCRDRLEYFFALYDDIPRLPNGQIDEIKVQKGFEGLN